jgi:hypothetical protein
MRLAWWCRCRAGWWLPGIAGSRTGCWIAAAWLWRRPGPISTICRLPGRLPRRGDPGPPGLPRPPPRAAAYRGIPHPHRHRMARIPRPLRAPQARHRPLRPRLRHPLHPRALLPALRPALARPRPAAPHRRNPRRPHRPHRRSRTRRLARRSRRPQNQPRRRQGQARPDRPPLPPHHRPRHAHRPPHTLNSKSPFRLLTHNLPKFRECRIEDVA